jgi:hypothetical protein
MSAPTAAEALIALQERLGRGLTPTDVVEEGKKPKSDLHRFFEWDVNKAAHQAWLTRAQDLIQKCHVDVTITPRKTVSVRAFVHIQPLNEEGEVDFRAPGVYEPIATVARDPELRERVLAQMEREWKALRARYRAHEEAFLALVQQDIAA